MPLTDLLLQQLADPFRIGLIVALVFTAVRTQPVTGTVVPLLAGLLFVAVIIPSTISPPGADGFWPAVATGLVANTILLAVVLAVRALVLRLRG
jgi:hypothetical protein